MSILAAELIARLSADTGPADRELRNWASGVGRQGGALSGLTSVFTGTMLADGVKAIGRGIINVGRVGAGVFMDLAATGASFEAQMDAVSAVLGGTAEDAEALGDLAIRLAIDPNLQVDAQGAADAIHNLATAGLTADEILGGAAEASVLLANATGGQLGQAATVATDVMALFNIGAGDMMEAVDGIAAVANVSKFDLDDYARAIAQAGGVAALSGVDFEDFNAIIAATAPAFASGSDAGTSFKTFLQRLQPTTKEAADLMGELGLMTEEGTSVFYDANGALREMDEIVGIMSGTFGDMTEAQQTFYLGQIFGTDAMRTAGQMSRMTRKEYQALLRAMGQTDALESAKIRTDNFKSAMENLGGAVEAVKLSIWDGLEPAAQQLVETILPAVDMIAPHLEQWAQGIGDWFEDKIPVVEVAVKTAFEISDGDWLASVMAGLGELTGAKVTLDTEAHIINVDWGKYANYTYKADGEISTWDFGWVQYTYSADGKINSLTFGDQTVSGEGRGVLSLGLELYALKLPSNTKGSFMTALFGDPREAGANFREQLLEELDAGSFSEAFQTRMENLKMDWSGFRADFDAQMEQAKTDWGEVWGDVQSITVEVGDVVWGMWTNVYDVTALVRQMFWGTWTHIYDVMANIRDVLWGAWTHTYDGITNIKDWINGIGTIVIPGRVNIDGHPVGDPQYPGEPDVQYPGNAMGDPMFRGGWTWVGERGPELVRLPRASRIYDDQESAGMGGNGVTFNQYNTVRRPHEAKLIAQYTMQEAYRKSRR